MAYLSRRSMTLNGTNFAPGEPVPQAVIDRIDPGRMRSMLRVGVLMEASAAQINALLSPDPSGEGEMCDVCGGGPFKRLAQHMTKTHPETEES